MYVPQHFQETRVEVLHELIRAHPLATVVTLAAGGINANHIPLLLALAPDGSGTLRGHVARANPMWSDRVEQVEALAIFQGPHAYVSPSWYPAKREHGKVVPTWNYVVVHAHGPLRVIDDPAWLRGQLESLVARHEALSASPWSISDAPDEFITRMIESIVGFEITVSRLVGKWKVSQNQTGANRAGAVAGLIERGGADDLQVAALIEEASRDRRSGQ
ncbi:MAG TPA: FMN-binding negative transcriptional regulator [Burkholderiaceae bacterium]|jgi:transcriptional regulator|nr:FMN-binding negative transcriptional regulator [Burkholderiaceae bacterium]